MALDPLSWTKGQKARRHLGFALGVLTYSPIRLCLTPKTMFKKCQQFGESLEFLVEIGDRPESQVMKWGLSRGDAS